MKILVRLPNWLGDMVMSVGFVKALQETYPHATISVIAKKGIHELLPFFPAIEHPFVFSKDTHGGIHGLWRFGREIRRTAAFDLFFSLPDSFSAAFMGFATGADKRVGYRNEGRNLLLTHAYAKPKGLHRADEYVHLLKKYAGSAPETQVKLQHAFTKEDHIVVNINSEASSRRLTVAKAVELLTALRAQTDQKIILVGGNSEKDFVEGVMAKLHGTSGMESYAGRTSLSTLAELLATAQLVLTTDSGPAHLANALGTHTIVLFGAGNENNTGPYQRELRSIIRLGKLSCEPCLKNVCVQFGTPQCLELLPTTAIIDTLKAKLH